MISHPSLVRNMWCQTRQLKVNHASSLVITIKIETNLFDIKDKVLSKYTFSFSYFSRLFYSSLDRSYINFGYSIEKKSIHEITGELLSVSKVSDDISFNPKSVILNDISISEKQT